MGDASLHGMETSSGARQYGVTHVLTKVLAMSPDRTPGPAHSRIQRPAGRAATDPERSASCVEDGTAGLERHRHHVRPGARDRARTGVQRGRAGSTLDRKSMGTGRELMARMARKLLSRSIGRSVSLPLSCRAACAGSCRSARPVPEAAGRPAPRSRSRRSEIAGRIPHPSSDEEGDTLNAVHAAGGSITRGRSSRGVPPVKRSGQCLCPPGRNLFFARGISRATLRRRLRVKDRC